MKLSILDYAIVDEGKTAIEAIKESTELAYLAEKLGYSRFWMAEHHQVPALASSSPELLMLHLLQKLQGWNVSDFLKYLPRIRRDVH